MKKLFIYSLLFMLAGCATTSVNKEANERYNQMMDSFLGEPERTLVRAWGPPDRSHELDGVKYLKYSSSRTVAVPAPLQVNAPSYNRFMMYGGGSASVYCDNTFEIQYGLVVAWRLKGNGCR